METEITSKKVGRHFNVYRNGKFWAQARKLKNTAEPNRWHWKMREEEFVRHWTGEALDMDNLEKSLAQIKRAFKAFDASQGDQ